MTDEELSAMLVAMRDTDPELTRNTEADHIAADKAICVVLHDLGYTKSADIYADLIISRFWYS
jgi:hypothetical protein